MPDTKRALQVASGTYNEPMSSRPTIQPDEFAHTRKPEPPVDLWEQLDAAIESVGASRPPNSFTKSELMSQRNITVDQASKLVYKLTKAGKIIRKGTGVTTYYVLVEEK